MDAVDELAAAVGVAEACRVLGAPRSSHYRARQLSEASPPASHERPTPARCLSAEERTAVRDVLNSERFQDCAPREVYATLLDEQIYLCSWRTMYRILAVADEVRERRDQVRHPAYTKPELLATRPRELWSWDITKLKGPTTWTYYYLYVILDVFSRYVVGWMISERETAELAEAFIAETCAKEGICQDQLTLHADRGSAMTSKSVAQLLADLGVTKTHSRPHVSNDNPYSESQVGTLKYRPGFPAQFGSLADARAWAHPFFQWYNHEHHHSGIGLLTPATVHGGQATETIAARQQVLTAAYLSHPERFVRGAPTPPTLPTAVWINPPIALVPETDSLTVVRDRAPASAADSS
jgi:putative transposase